MSAEQRALKNNTQFCMPQRTTVRFSMVLKIRFSTKRPSRQMPRLGSSAASAWLRGEPSLEYLPSGSD